MHNAHSRIRTTGLIQFFSKGRLPVGLFDLGGGGGSRARRQGSEWRAFFKVSYTSSVFLFSSPPPSFFLWGKCKCVTCLCPGGTVGIIPRGQDAAAPLLRNYEDARSRLPTKIHGEKVCIFYFWRFYEGKRSYILFLFFLRCLCLSSENTTSRPRWEREGREKKLFFPSSPLISPFPILRSRQKPKCLFPKKEIKLKREGI